MSFLESSLEAVSTLPSEVARNLYLIGELDEGSNAELAKLKELQALYLDAIRVKIRALVWIPCAPQQGEKQTAEGVLEAESEQLEELERKREQMLQTSEEKVAIAEQSFSLVDRRIREIEELMFRCEDQLRHQGAFDVSRLDRGTPLMSGEVVTEAMKPEYQYHFADNGYRESPVHDGPEFVGDSGAALAPLWQGASAAADPSGTAAAKPSVKPQSMPAQPPPPSTLELYPTDPAQQFCYCKRGQFGKMIGCENDDCPVGNGWFHLSCVGIDRIPAGAWYCPTCARAKGITGMPGTIPPDYEEQEG